MSKKNFSSKFLTAGAVVAAAAFGLKKLNEQKNQQAGETPETAAALEVTASETVEEEMVAAEEDAKEESEAEKDNGITE